MNSKKTRKKTFKRVPKNFPCSCGHPKSFHESADAPIWEQWCAGFTPAQRNKYGRTYNCDCERFVPDNLKYLEQCTQKKGKGD